MAGDGEYPPLLEEGLHAMSAVDLKALVVDRFPLSKTRPSLWQNFVEILGEIEASGLRCQIWVNGSFLTEKIDPKDVDFVCDFSVNALKEGTIAQLDLIEKLSKRDITKRKQLHGWVMFSAPSGHSYYPTSKKVRAQWNKDFGFSYVKREPKGIAVLEVRS